MEKKVKVFVSSTYEDMQRERDIAFQALLKNGNIIGGMEFFTGDNIEKFEVIKTDINDSDILILILGGRYGTICKETNKSFIHMEYEYAKSIGIPIGVIMISDKLLMKKKQQAYSEGETYYNEGSKKYAQFSKIVSSKMVSYYSDDNELSLNIVTTVSKMCNNYKIDGWIKCNDESLKAYLSQLSLDRLIELSGSTIVKHIDTTEKDQYRLSNKLFYESDTSNTLNRLKSIFLMQRSSSLVLGAESGWRAEKDFLKSLKKSINICYNFYHIVNIEGIENHLKRESSIFPEFGKFSNNFININGYVAVKKNNEECGGAFVKKLPLDESNPLFKLDRQVRLLAVEKLDNSVEGVFVWNIGKDESCMRVAGVEMEKYLLQLKKYYEECDYVFWDELVDLYNKYKK